MERVARFTRNFGRRPRLTRLPPRALVPKLRSRVRRSSVFADRCSCSRQKVALPPLAMFHGIRVNSCSVDASIPLAIMLAL